MLAIYKKELRSYFTSMIGYVFMSLFLSIVSFYFYLHNLSQRVANFEYTVSNVSFIFVLLVPLLTMRIIAEENRQKTDQLLLTSPVTATDIVLGKFFAVFSILAMIIAVISTYPLIMTRYGKVPFASAYASIIGFLLLGGAYLAMGLFLSSLTDSQVIAGVITFIVFFLTLILEVIARRISTSNKTAYIAFVILWLVVCLVLWIMMRNLTVAFGTGIAGVVALTGIYMAKPVLFDGALIKVASWLSAMTRFSNFYRGILDLSDIIYYISLIFVFLFLTIQAIKKKRWS